MLGLTILTLVISVEQKLALVIETVSDYQLMPIECCPCAQVLIDGLCADAWDIIDFIRDGREIKIDVDCRP